MVTEGSAPDVTVNLYVPPPRLMQAPAATVPATAREAAAQFAALLTAAAFKPLATALGFYGDIVVDGVAQSLARSERGGLTDRLAQTIANAER